MKVFVWYTNNAQLKEKPRILSAQFGDGYSQDSEDGLNADLQTWELVFDDVHAYVALEIRAFLKARKAVEAFIYHSLLSEDITVKCREWDVKPSKSGRLTVTATFNQVP